jgi:aminoglycoside 6'-N-acetyltransferase I
MPGPTVEPCTLQALEDWVALRHALWPEGSAQDLRSEAQALLWEQRDFIALLARLPDGTAAGLAEAALRHDYVNGCATSPVAFLEGIYVRPEHRNKGLARLLCRAVEDWAKRRGCREFASDVLLDNTGSQTMHRALGFEETERVVYYRKTLSPS